VTGAELLAYTRELLRDTVSPYLWSDTTVYRYLNDAQRIMAERTFCLVDDENYDIATEIGVRSYTLDNDEILQVLGARISGQTTPLSPGFSPVTSAFFSNTVGLPTNYSQVGGRLKISFTPTPDAVYTVNLIVAIRPTTTISTGVAPEVPAPFHLALADYAASKCLIHNDVDGINITSAEAFGRSFNEAVRDLKAQIYHYRLGPDANVVPMRIT